MKQIFRSLLVILPVLGLLTGVRSGFCQEIGTPPRKTFIDYFLPMPINGALSKDAWGAAEAGARDQQNGLEDANMARWSYWDGQIIKAPDGKYHLFASRWDQAKGHSEWPNSKAVHAVSDKFTGPYLDKGLCWPDNQGGRGHNVTALALPDGRYGVVISETRPGTVFVSKSLEGPWEQLGVIKGEGLHASNISIMVRPDGDYMIVPRSGQVFISKAADGILGPYKSVGPSAFPKGIPNLEDPCIFYSGDLYHIIVNSWSERKAYHLTSRDGKNDWVNRGIAYDPTKAFIRYTDGTVNRWHKLERPGVLMENGHVTAMTFAVLDTPKDNQTGNNGHGSKIIVVPFDGAALDRDLQHATGTTSPAQEDKTAAALNLPPPSRLVIVKAVYGELPDGNKADVTAKIAALVTDDALAVAASNDLFGDPAVGHDKQLRVEYALDGVKKSKTVEENEMLTISAAGRTATGQPADASPDLLVELKNYPHKILFETKRDGNGEIYRINADGSNPVNLTQTPDVDELYPKASPDGSLFCCLADEGAGAKRARNLYVMNADGGARKKIADNASDPCWSADGKQIAFLKGEFERYGLMDFETRGIFIYNLASGQTRQHPNKKIKHLYCLNWSADGKWFVAVIHGGLGFGHNIVALEAAGNGIFDLHCYGCRPDVSFDDKLITWNNGDSCLGVADLDLRASPPKTANQRNAIESDGPAEAYHSDWSPGARYLAFSRGVKRETKNLHGQLAAFAGAEAPGWNICVADARATNRWVQLTFDGESNKEPDWQFGKAAGDK